MPRLATTCLLLMLTLIGSLAASGCAGSRSASLEDGGLTGRLNGLGFTPRWVYRLPVVKRGVSAFDLLGERLVLVEGRERLVTALSAADGSTLWRQQIGSTLNELLAPLQGPGDQLVVANGSRIFVLDGASGVPERFRDLPQPIAVPGVSDGGTAYFGGRDGRIFALDLQSSQVRWQYQLTAGVAARLLLDRGALLAGDTAGTYASFGVDRGTLRFRNRVFGPILTQPVAFADLKMLPSSDFTLYALDAATGQERWVYRADRPLDRSPVALGDTLYLPVPGRSLVALTAEGDVRWELSRPAAAVAMSPQGLLAVSDGTLLLLDADTGRLIRELPDLRVRNTLTGPGGEVYLILQDHSIYRLDPLRP